MLLSFSISFINYQSEIDFKNRVYSIIYLVYELNVDIITLYSLPPNRHFDTLKIDKTDQKDM